MSTQALSRGSRLAARPWSRRLRAWRPWLIGLAVLALLVFVTWVFLFSSWLGVRGVKIDADSTTTVEQIAQAARVTPGTPLARVDLAGVKQRVEAIPTVASASVTRSWPHTVVVRVTDRRPVAAVSEDGGWRLMDDTGVLYMTVPQPDPALPVVELEGSPRPETTPQVAAVLRALPAHVLTGTRRVRAASMDSITLLLDDGRTVQWGSATLSHEKATVLQALLQTKARDLDVSVPSHPATHS